MSLLKEQDNSSVVSQKVDPSAVAVETNSSAPHLCIQDKELWRLAAEGDIFARSKIADRVGLQFADRAFDHDRFTQLVREFYEDSVTQTRSMSVIAELFKNELEQLKFMMEQKDTKVVPQEKKSTIWEDPTVYPILLYFLMLFGPSKLYDSLIKDTWK